MFDRGVTQMTNKKSHSSIQKSDPNKGTNRRGMVSTIALIAPIVVLLVTAFVMLGIGADVLSELKENQNPSVTTRTNNETAASYILNYSIAFNLTNTRVENASSIILSNGSGATVNSNNYTITYFSGGQAQINLSPTNGASLDGNKVGVNYTYTTGTDTSAVNATGGGIGAFEEFGSFGSTTGLVAVAVIVMAMIILGFLLVGVKVKLSM